jgi:hypothetical protein
VLENRQAAIADRGASKLPLLGRALPLIISILIGELDLTKRTKRAAPYVILRATLRLWRRATSLSPPEPGKRATYAAVPRCALVLRNVGPLLRVPLASSLGVFYGRRARDVLTLSKWTAASVPAGHKPRHSTMRPGNAVAPATEVGVVDATIANRPCQQGHTGSLPLSVLVGESHSARRGTQGGPSVRSRLLPASQRTLPRRNVGFWLSERSYCPT